MFRSQLLYLVAATALITACGGGGGSDSAGRGSSSPSINSCDLVSRQANVEISLSASDFSSGYETIQTLFAEKPDHLAISGELLMVLNERTDTDIEDDLKIIRTSDFCMIDERRDTVHARSMYFQNANTFNMDGGGTGVSQYSVDRSNLTGAICITDNATCISTEDDSVISNTMCVSSTDAAGKTTVADSACVSNEGADVAGSVCIQDDLDMLDYINRYRSYYSSLDSEIISDYLYQASLSDGVAVSNLASLLESAANTETVIDICGGQARSLARTSSLVFIAARESGLYVADASTAGSPRLIANYDTADQIVDVVALGDYVYAMGFNAVHILNINNPNSPVVEAVFDLSDVGYNNSITINDGHVVVANEGGALLVYQHGANPESGKLISISSTPEMATYSDGAIFVISDSGIHKLTN